jgi:phospholipid transport system transporter-binding protein
MKAFQVNLTSDSLKLVGHLDFAQVVQLSQQPQFGLRADIKTIDLSDLSYIDSAGISLLLEWYKIAKQAGNILQFIQANQQVKQLIELYDLDFLGC